MVSDVRGEGFVRHPFVTFKDQLATKKGHLLKGDDIARDIHKLWDSGKFADVGRRVDVDPANKDNRIVIFWVVEYPTILNVPIVGAKAEDPRALYDEVLRLKIGSELNPHKLKLDKQDILSRYRQKGYHFCEVLDETSKVGDDVVLTWRIFEGPLVNVDEIIFKGNITVPLGDLRGYMATREGGLFSSSPYIEKNLREDIERLKWNYRLEGFLDIYEGNQIFVEEVEFSADKRDVKITIHIDESRRYHVRNVFFKGNTVLTQEDLMAELVQKPNSPMSERDIYRSSLQLKQAYGERAYINAEVEPQWVVLGDSFEVDVTYTVKEGEKVSVGRVLITGNTRTKENRIRLDLRDDILPGEEFNVRRLQRAMQRLRDRGWFEQSPEGVTVKYEPTEIPTVKDVVIAVREGETTRIQFAAGFSSSFGIIGMIEYQQRNFDISDFPDSFADIPSSFVGAGQSFRIRLSPGASRQQYSVDFRDPYFFGMDISFGTAIFLVTTSREEWEEESLGGNIGFEKRLGTHLSAGLNFRGVRTTIFGVTANAPPSLTPFIGTNTTISVEPVLVFDSRDSFVIPTEGTRMELGYEVSWKGIGSDFNFTKLRLEFQHHIPIYKTEAKSKHVLSLSVKASWVEEFPPTQSVPINERFYAGGRGLIRGFAFRGIGPQENGVPIGGDVLLVGTVEYTIPIYQQILYGAVWYDIGTLETKIRFMPDAFYRQAAGFGLRFLVPALGNIPIALDFGWALSSSFRDQEQIVLFDFGRFFQ